MAMTVTYTTINGQIVSENRSGTQSFYVADSLGSTVALMNSSGTVTDTFTYWPFGEITSHIGSSVIPFTFVGTLGYYLQILNNFTYVRARYLRQGLARWQTLDPLWPSEPPYVYALSRPTTSVDPTGTYVQFPDPGPGGPPWLQGLNDWHCPIKVHVWPPSIEIVPFYGKYCGPQTVAGVGNGVSQVDNCCRTHDNCFASQKPPCTAFNQYRKQCKACTAALCSCVKGANCALDPGCVAAKTYIPLYACNPHVIG